MVENEEKDTGAMKNAMSAFLRTACLVPQQVFLFLCFYFGFYFYSFTPLKLILQSQFLPYPSFLIFPILFIHSTTNK